MIKWPTVSLSTAAYEFIDMPLDGCTDRCIDGNVYAMFKNIVYYIASYKYSKTIVGLEEENVKNKRVALLETFYLQQLLFTCK